MAATGKTVKASGVAMVCAGCAMHKGPAVRGPSEGPTVESVLKSLIFRNWWIFLCKRRHTNEHFRIVRFGLSQTFVSTVIV